LKLKNLRGLSYTFGSTVDILASVHTFSSNEIFGVQLVSVGVSEDNSSEGASSARVVDNLLDNTLDISIES